MKYIQRVKGFASLTAIVVLILVVSTAARVGYAQTGPNQVDVSLFEWGIDMPLSLPAGETHINVTNNGTFPHNLVIEGQGIEASLPTNLMPGEAQVLVVDLQPGAYRVYCPVGNHAGQGMELSLTVTEAEQGGQTASPVDPTATSVAGTEQPQAPTATVVPGEEGQVPVTGEHQGFSVGPVAQPGLSGQIDLQIELVQVAEGFNDPVNVVAAPDGSGRMFVVERNGLVRIVQDGEILPDPFLDLRDDTLDAFLEQGLYDIEFHPDFATNGLFYIHFAELLRNGDSMIVEYHVSADNPNAADPESARIILHIPQPWANHNGGELAFGPDGYLYIGSGDGGWEGDPLEAGQDMSTLLGKLLRIDVNTDGQGAYRVPDDNPFADEPTLVQLFNIEEETFAEIHTEARPEIWAYGLRNPWKFQFDPETGDLYLPDVGQNHWEEINFQPADSQGGENYGWDLLMGSHCFPLNKETCDPVGEMPVAEYSHDLGVAVVGLGVYRGDEFPTMDGIYLVGDWGSGRIWGLQRGENDTWVFDELIDTDTRITGSGQGSDGRIYITTCNCEYGGGLPEENQPGALWYIVPADQVPEGAQTSASLAPVPVTGGESQQATPMPTGQAGQPGEDGTVRAPLENQQPIGLEEVATGLTAPVFVTTPGDDSGRLFIVDQAGLIHIVDETGNLLDEPFLDVRDRMVELRPDFDERGLLGLAFHPDYAANGRFFVYYNAPLREGAPADWNNTIRISEFTVSETNPDQANLETERVLLEVDDPQFNHNGGTVTFGPDGYLYISIGDGGGADDVGIGHVEDWYDVNEGGNGQDVSQNLLGNILRIDVDALGAADQPYGIPADNPFVDQTGDQAAMPEIYAYGFRNPYRFSFDRGGENQLFVADVGQNAYEEVSIVESGGNYGWNVKEGTHCFSTANPDVSLDTCPDTDPQGNPLIDPVIEYVNNNQEGGIGISVTGGYVYRGTQMPDLVGSYVFGDWSLSFDEPRGSLFVSTPQEEGLWPITQLVPQGMEFNYFVLGFGEDADGEMYVTTSQSAGPTGSTGTVFRLVPAQPDTGVQPTPQTGTTPTQPAGAPVQPTPMTTQPAAPADPLVQPGEMVFNTFCTACHGAEGQANIGPALAGEPVVTQEDPTPVIQIVLEGRGQMPAFGSRLSDDQIAQVISFIRNAWGNSASVVQPEQVHEIREGS